MCTVHCLLLTPCNGEHNLPTIMVQVKNTRQEEVEIEVSEQVPLSQDDRIKVCRCTDCTVIYMYVLYIYSTLNIAIAMFKVEYM